MGSELPDAFSRLGAAIGILSNTRTLKLAGLDTILAPESPDSSRFLLT